MITVITRYSGTIMTVINTIWYNNSIVVQYIYIITNYTNDIYKKPAKKQSICVVWKCVVQRKGKKKDCEESIKCKLFADSDKKW